MLYLTCTTITSVDLAHYGASRAKDWVFVDCGTMKYNLSNLIPYNIIRVELFKTDQNFRNTSVALTSMATLPKFNAVVC